MSRVFFPGFEPMTFEEMDKLPSRPKKTEAAYVTVILPGDAFTDEGEEPLHSFESYTDKTEISLFWLCRDTEDVYDPMISVGNSNSFVGCDYFRESIVGYGATPLESMRHALELWQAALIEEDRETLEASFHISSPWDA